MEIIVNRYANALLTFTHTEGAAKLDLVAEVVVGNKLLKLLYDLSGSFNVARAADTYCDFHCFYLLYIIIDIEQHQLKKAEFCNLDRRFYM